MLHCPQDAPHFQCCKCNTPILRAGDISSGGYRIRSGSAYLARAAWNLATSDREDEVTYTSGTYRVRDVSCKTCGQCLGVTYADAMDERNAHKVGSFLLGQEELRRPEERGKAARQAYSRVSHPGERYLKQAARACWSELERRSQAAWSKTGVVTPPLAVSPSPQAAPSAEPTPAESIGTEVSADPCTAAPATATGLPVAGAAPLQAEATVLMDPAVASEPLGAEGCPAAQAAEPQQVTAEAPDAATTAPGRLATRRRPAASRTASPQVARDSQGGKRPAAYFGICDLKYDRRRPRGRRLFVLELGNGRSSRFSGSGECIPRNCQKFKLVSPLDRSLLVENKKMTHDVFVDCNFEHLRPKQVCFPRVYTAELAEQVLLGLGLGCEGGEDLVVLKLLNRCRGAGVVVARASQLDETLRRLLSPPDEPPRADTGTGSLEDALSLDPASMQEQCLHWWSNECPLFAAERCEASQPVCQDGLEYDGTLRVGFVLLRTGEGDDETLAADFLGGYWKLPKEPISSSDARARCVSKARSGTAPVDPEDLEDVCQELRTALPAVFESERAGMVPSLMRRYGQEPLAFSFALARHAAAKAQQKALEHARAVARGAEPSESAGWASTPAGRQQLASVRLLFEMAEARLVEEDPAAFRESLPSRDPATRTAASYIERQLGVLDAHMGDWGGASVRFQRALELHRWNASAQYLVGLCQQRRLEHSLARESFARSIMMDPDFKAPYACLGAAALALGDWECTASVSVSGLARHPQAFHCDYNLGLALAYELQHGLGLLPSAPSPEEVASAEAPVLAAPDPPAWPRLADAAEADVEGRPHVQCGVCGNPLLKVEDILSADFRSESGPAYLACAAYNVRPAGDLRRVAYASGEYEVQDAACSRCGKCLAVRYIGAAEEKNRQKVGNFLIAQNFTVKKAPKRHAAAPAGQKSQAKTEEKQGPPGVQTPPVAPAPAPLKVVSPAPAAPARELSSAAFRALAALPALEARPSTVSSVAEAAALELRRAKEQKEQARTEWSDKDDELLGVLEKLSVCLAVAPQRVAAAAAVVGARRSAPVDSCSSVVAADGAATDEVMVEAVGACREEEEFCTQLCDLLATRSGWSARHFRG